MAQEKRSARSALLPLAPLTGRSPRGRGKNGAARSRTEPVPKLGARVASAIEQEIIRLGWPVGRVLGTEAQLMARFEVSRATLREGIRQVERHGMATMRRGIGGGLVVDAPARSATVRALATYLELIDATFEEMLEARIALEAPAARLAAERIDADGAARLKAIIEPARSAPPETLLTSSAVGMQLRKAIAEISGNPAIALFIDAANRYGTETIAPHVPRGSQYKDELRRALKGQETIADAVIRGDAARAERAIREDSASGGAFYGRLIKRHAINGEGPPATPSEGKSGAAREPGPKLGQSVALAIARDIANARLAPGYRLGSEPELLERYSVSRAVFREAVRMLELHGITRPQRGHGGGLVVDVPNAQYTVDAATLYLRYVRFTRAAMVEVRKAVELAAAELATRRAKDTDIDELRAALARQQAADPAETVTAAAAFHNVLGELSGNRAIALYLRVVIGFTMSYPAERMPAARIEAINRSHANMLDAIARHDETLARKRVLAHIRLAMTHSRIGIE